MAKANKYVKIAIIGGSVILVAATTYYILKKKGVIKWGIIPLDYDKEIAKLFVAINALSQADRNAKMTGSELTPAERTKALQLMLAYGKDKTKLSAAEKEELYRYLQRVFGNTVNAEGTGKGARSWHIPVYYPHRTEK